MSCVGMAGENDHFHHIGALCELLSKIRTQRRRVLERGTPSVKVRFRLEAARLAARLKRVRSSAKSAPSSSSASKGSAQEVRPGRRLAVKREAEVWNGEVEGVGSTKAGCREPDTDMSFAKRAESSSDSGSPGEIGDHVTYSSEVVLILVIEVTSFTTCQDESSAEWHEYARSRIPKYVLVHHTKVREEAEGSANSGSLERFSWHALHESVASRTKNDEVWKFCQGARRTGLERFYYRRVFCGNGLMACSVFEEPEAMAKEMLRLKAVSAKVMRHDGE